MNAATPIRPAMTDAKRAEIDKSQRRYLLRVRLIAAFRIVLGFTAAAGFTWAISTWSTVIAAVFASFVLLVLACYGLGDKE